MNDLEDILEEEPNVENELPVVQGFDDEELPSIVEENQQQTGPKDVKSNALEGLSFVISGVFDAISREGLE